MSNIDTLLESMHGVVSETDFDAWLLDWANRWSSDFPEEIRTNLRDAALHSAQLGATAMRCYLHNCALVDGLFKDALEVKT